MPVAPAGERLATVRLTRPALDGGVSVGAALRRRRSIREFEPVPLALKNLGDLLWAAQGLSGGGLRTAPSAGATHPLEIYAVAGDVGGLAAGLYRYAPLDHALVGMIAGDCRVAVAAACAGQAWVANAPAMLVISADEARTAARYGEMARIYVAMEAGCAAENVALAAVSLGLGTVMVGAFDRGELAAALQLSRRHAPLCVLPVGRQWRV